MDLAKLAAIAAAATHGRREVDYTQDGHPVILIPDFYKTAEPDRRARVLYEGDWATPEDVEFDATFDPETVLELISTIAPFLDEIPVKGYPKPAEEQPTPLDYYPQF